MTRLLRLPEPRETWRSPNGHECLIGDTLGNCVWLEDIGYFNRKMIALTWSPLDPADPDALTDEEAPCPTNAE